jgi:hypothetical protein
MPGAAAVFTAAAAASLAVPLAAEDFLAVVIAAALSAETVVARSAAIAAEVPATAAGEASRELVPHSVAEARSVAEILSAAVTLLRCAAQPPVLGRPKDADSATLPRAFTAFNAVPTRASQDAHAPAWVPRARPSLTATGILSAAELPQLEAELRSQPLPSTAAS